MGSDLSIGVLYFGSSGAGVKFTELLRDELSKDGKNIVIMARKKELLFTMIQTQPPQKQRSQH